MSESLSYKLKKVNKQLATAELEIEEALVNVKHVNELAILYINQQGSYKMSDVKKTFSKYKNYKGEPIIEFDEVMNNADLITKEFTITCDQVTGKIWIASEADDSQVILQGIIAGYINNKDETVKEIVPGAHFDYVDICKTAKDAKAYEGYKPASFTGSIFFENLPLEVLTPSKEVKEEPKIEAKVKPNNYVEPKVEPRVEEQVKLPSYETLSKLPKGQLKPPRGLSRTARNRFNKAMRDKYPAAFDKGGNWIGFETEYATGPPKVDMKDDSEYEVAETTEMPDRMVVGGGNLLTAMVDIRIPGSWFIGRFYEGRGVAVVSTNEDKFDDSAWIICNKEKTAEFVLAGLRKNIGYAKMVEGCKVYSVDVLNKRYLTKKDIPVYYISNGVTALQSLGTKESDIFTIKNKVN